VLHPVLLPLLRTTALLPLLRTTVRRDSCQWHLVDPTTLLVAVPDSERRHSGTDLPLPLPKHRVWGASWRLRPPPPPPPADAKGKKR
jgi:hypothetical protein